MSINDIIKKLKHAVGTGNWKKIVELIEELEIHSDISDGFDPDYWHEEEG